MLFSYPDAKYEQDPFPHAVIKGAWSEDLLAGCKQEALTFTEWDGEKSFHGAQRKRFCGSPDKLPTATKLAVQEASGPAFLEWLEEVTGEKSLIPDPYLMGGGMHSIRTGGFLKIHADFNWHPKLHLYRRLNVLLYLNEWHSAWGGHLELWKQDACAKKVAPERNTMVVFTTDDASFHGHPEPLACPDYITRDSIALYYYSAFRPERNFKVPRLNTDYR